MQELNQSSSHLNKMQAFHGSSSVKDAFVQDLRFSQSMCSIQGGDFLSVFMSPTSQDPAYFSTTLGIPDEIGYLLNVITSGLDRDLRDFPLLAMIAISPGMNLKPIWFRFIEWLLCDPMYGVLRFTEGDAHKSVADLGDFFSRLGEGSTKSPDGFEWYYLMSKMQAMYQAVEAAKFNIDHFSRKVAAELEAVECAVLATYQCPSIAAQLSIHAVRAVNWAEAETGDNHWAAQSTKLLGLIAEAKGDSLVSSTGLDHSTGFGSFSPNTFADIGLES